MESSILRSTKKILGLGPTDASFDLDVITHINAVFFNLSQLGVGPSQGFMIEDESANWEDFIADDNSLLNAVKTYVYLCVRLVFDPPTTSYQISAAKEQVAELAWRMNVHRESTDWVDPFPVVSVSE
jgi:hypothetical protein